MSKYCINQNFNEASFEFTNINANDVVVLVSSSEESFALPQAIVIREVINRGAFVVSAKIDNLGYVLSLLKVRPNFVITQSILISKVIETIGNDINITTFSCLFAKFKGNFNVMLEGVKKLDTLKNGDKVLIVEGCIERSVCRGIGRNEIPSMIKSYTSKELVFEFVSGGDFSSSLDDCVLVIHCGGCMLSKEEVLNRIDMCQSKNIPITNYGLAICKTKGLLDKVIKEII